jgi:hypothetical protein
MFAPDEGAGLTRSVVHGFRPGIGGEIATAFSATGSGETLPSCDEERSVVRGACADVNGIHHIQQGLMRTIRLRNPDKCVDRRILPTWLGRHWNLWAGVLAARRIHSPSPSYKTRAGQARARWGRRAAILMRS